MRIKLIRDRIAARNEKMANHPVVQKTKAANEADDAMAIKLEAELTKKRADQARRDDNHAKILIGAGVLLMPSATLMTTMRMISSLLDKRHGQWLEKWFEGHGANTPVDIAKENQSIEESDAASVAIPVSQTSIVAIDPIGEALKEVIGTLNEGDFGVLGPEILAHTTQETRTIIENWFDKIIQNR